MAALQETSFRAMGTSCRIAVVAESDGLPAAAALSAGIAEIARCEDVLSRFDAASDLSRVNRASGAWVAVDGRLVDALAAALAARAETGGRFDPTVLPALIAAGYDRSFERLRLRPARSLRGWRAGAAIELDRDGSRVRLAPGAAIDLGGIGKGFSATLALRAMRAAWPALPGGLVDLGGDVALAGRAPEGGPWRIAVADPRRPGARLATLEVQGGGIATSGRDARRFGPGRRLHHLIDPATGEPAAGVPLTVTVVASGAAEAEAHATSLAITPLEQAPEYVAGLDGISALVVPDRGEPLRLGELPLTRETPQAFRLAAVPRPAA
jgi:thiamine biosynthesis lipoprotein